ncbi:MAG: glycosyl hydrolase 115 family protein [Bacteroidales bacterium]|nr:glycosyl hydrolase 115 family protein [Bacteroidales bacterium]MCF8390437.1 glycosyl hydrolase 115 family protein [Bacteroidales bacterium]
MMLYKSNYRILIILTLSVFLFTSLAGRDGDMSLEKNSIRIVFSENEEGPLKIALEALENDIYQIIGSKPEVARKMDREKIQTEIVIVNLASGNIKLPSKHLKELDGFESHRVYANQETNRIYLLGNDLRGTIYAIYTFSEKVLGVPPLKYWSSWTPIKKEIVNIPANLDIYFKTPQVRYRSLLPGDQDFFNPWRKEAEVNDNIWLETALRLKLNTIETYSTIIPDYKLTNYAYLIDKFGLVITSHHTSGLNTSFGTWANYWREVRGMPPPEYLLSNESAILDFFRYNAETVKKSGIENLWTIAFRGEVDQPYWSIFKDAPEGDKERADVINKMLQIQYDLVKEMTGEEEPYARITFYDELAILMAKGYLNPPVSENMILTFVAGRRDHYPYDDIVNFKADNTGKLGYYMNFGFASTGAHIAPAESPWKMEFNYRYVNSKAPLYFSVVNVGNFREFVLELSANAKMLWDFDSYSTDEYMEDYCSQYFGSEYAAEIAKLFEEFYHAYWIPKESELEGLERQFVFQDLRYARAFDHVLENFYSTDAELNLNPLHKIGYESVPGRTFRIDLEYNNAENQVDAILNGLQKTIPKFESVAAKCSEMMIKLDNDKQIFFNDNLRVYSYYMTHLSKTLYHFIYAYKNQADKEVLIRNLDLAYAEADRAQQYLFESQHGIFSTWYSNADPLTRTFQIDKLKNSIKELREQALKITYISSSLEEKFSYSH